MSDMAPPPDLSAGSLLRQAREAAGLHIAALAVSLKVPVKKLEALEADRVDLLPDAVFARALASSVCRTLKVDSAAILERLPQNTAPRLGGGGRTINEPFRAPSDGPGPSVWDQLSRPVVLAVLALVLGALVLVFLPNVRPDGALLSAEGGTTATTREAAVANSGLFGPGGTPAAVAVSQPGAPALSPTLALSVALSTPTVASPTLVINAPALAPALAASAGSGATVAGTANGVVVFKTRIESWVEVTDAKGVVTLRRLLAAGESAGASGALPLKVIVGRADATDVQVRGKPLDLVPLAKDNVARFEVK